MTKYTIEKIAGKDMTVVWYGEPYDLEQGGANIMSDGSHTFFNSEHIHIATSLPALPKHPKPEDVALLYRYMAEGIEVIAQWKADNAEMYEIDLAVALINRENGALVFHSATDKDGNKISVAISSDAACEGE